MVEKLVFKSDLCQIRLLFIASLSSLGIFSGSCRVRNCVVIELGAKIYRVRCIQSLTELSAKFNYRVKCVKCVIELSAWRVSLSIPNRLSS